MMTLYVVVLFVHILGALALFAALSLEILTLSQLTQATSSRGVRLWVDLVPWLARMSTGSLVVLLFSGGYLTNQMSGWTLAWPKVTVAKLVLIATLGAITGKRMRAIRRICVADKTNDTELVNRLRDPFLKISLGIRIALGLGIVLLMRAKPGLRGSIGIIGSSLVLGFLWSLLRSRRAPLSTASAGARD
jgi:hypothetical protein